MDKRLNRKLSALDPRFKKQITQLLDSMHESISLLYDAATHDEKTGLYNNKFFESILEMEIEKFKRNNHKLSLIMVDIDFFKKINDTYGHMKADELLTRLGKVLMKQARKSDIVARFGGEELMILLPSTSITKAKRFASRLKTAIHSDNLLNKHNLTVSGGITEFKKKDTKSTFKHRADMALYKAKKQGRDRFISI